MGATTDCPGCGAPQPLVGHTCHYCGTTTGGGAATPTADGAAAADGAADDAEGRLAVTDDRREDAEGAASEDGADGPSDEPADEVPAELPAAQEARRFRGLAVPLVAAAVVLGVGYPLTALAVSQVGRPPVAGSGGAAPEEAAAAAAPGPAPAGSTGRARLAGAVRHEGPVTPIGCSSGPPRLVTLVAGPDTYSILVGVPAEAAPGIYPVEGTTAFVAVSRLAAGGQIWTTRGRAGATGTVTVGANRSVTAVFTGLEPDGGGAEGTVEGSVEVECA